jgi:hypothetical protein
MPDDAEWMYKELGRELAGRRRAAGLTQTEFALLTGRYSRATVSHAETGRGKDGGISRRFWETCDRLLGTGSFFAGSYDLLHDDGPPARTAVTSAGHHLQTGPAMKSAIGEQALRAYRRGGWPVTGHEGDVKLATGRAADALEVGRIAGMIAASAWKETNGAESTARGIPALPPVERSLTVIDAGDRWYFLVEPGSYPWTSTPARSAAPRQHIRWHSGGTVPAPPGQGTAWAYLPVAATRLAPAQAVIDLLAWAVTRVTGPARLTIRGTVTVAPAGKS